MEDSMSWNAADVVIGVFYIKTENRYYDWRLVYVYLNYS